MYYITSRHLGGLDLPNSTDRSLQADPESYRTEKARESWKNNDMRSTTYAILIKYLMRPNFLFKIEEFIGFYFVTMRKSLCESAREME